jgi:uncharacterized protein YbjT (DUF2867 family)
MKIIISGSLGNISKPLVIELVQKGYQVTVLSSKPEKHRDIETLGATAAIGSVEDVSFLTETFTGADAVYCMIPPNYHSNAALNQLGFYQKIGSNYAEAIQKSGVKRVIHLSSIGAHLSENTGIILGHHAVENILKQLSGVAITHMRPTAFFYNLNSFIPIIKHTGSISANYGAEDKVVWVSPLDIASAIAEEITIPLVGRKVKYVASEELTCNEVASILGGVIGKPDLEWTIISNEQLQARLEKVGMNPSLAAGLVEMNASMHSGELFQDYYLNRPTTLGKTKLTEFAKEFAIAFTK